MVERRLGRRREEWDPRLLRLKTVLRADLPQPPDKYHTDSQFLFKVPMNIWDNNRYGNCVICGRGNQTLRMEAYEQKKLLTISTDDINKEYFRESGGADYGLFMSEAMKSWQKEGWWVSGPATGARRLFRCVRPKPKPPTPPPTPSAEFHDIYAYGITHKDTGDVANCVYLLHGVSAALALPESAKNESIWEKTTGVGTSPGSWGHHCVFICGYDFSAPPYTIECITWGYKQLMTLDWFIKFCEQPFGVVDNRNAFTPDSPVDVEKLDAYLHSVMED